jgi:hypothetical protein
MSTHALGTADATMGMRVLRHLDLVVLVLALGVFAAAGLPILGWGAAAAAWLAQRAIAIVLERKARATTEPRAVAGLMVASMLTRGWLVAIAIFAAGLAENDAGLSAAVLFLLLFTVYLTVNMGLRPFEKEEGSA